MSQQNESQLTLIDKFAEKTKSGWKGLYQCSCGNKKLIRNADVNSGRTKSCGCLRKKVLSETKSANLTDKIFGYWKVLYRVEGQTGHGSIWHCRCEKCGTEKDVKYSNLVEGKSKSCGCLRKEVLSVDLTNRRFGSLVAKEPLYDYPKQCSEQSTYWRCDCDCGNSFITTAHRLGQGNTQSCGCLVSKGENKIKELLTSMGIEYLSQYSFNDLKDVSLLRFDFYLPKFNILIEYQGEQHYKNTEIWGGEEDFKDRIKKDNMKRNYCFKNNIKLIEIPYWDYNKLCEDYFINELGINIKED